MMNLYFFFFIWQPFFTRNGLASYNVRLIDLLRVSPVREVGGVTRLQGLIGATGLRGVPRLMGVSGLRGVPGLMGVTGLRVVPRLMGVTRLRGVPWLMGAPRLRSATRMMGVSGQRGVTGQIVCVIGTFIFLLFI